MHPKTIACTIKAESLIAKGDDDSIRYACLELRMAIEHLFYDLIPLYADEVPTDILKKWQPRQVIEALTDCDPHVQDDGRLGILDDQSQLVMLHETKGVTKRLIKDYWHKLGSYLHAPMAATGTDWTGISLFLQGTISTLRAYGDERVMANLGKFAQFECVCGRRIKRNFEALKIKPVVVCPDVACGAIWNYSEKDGLAVFEPSQASYVCPQCNTINFFEARFAINGTAITCCECETKVCLTERLIPEPVT